MAEAAAPRRGAGAAWLALLLALAALGLAGWQYYLKDANQTDLEQRLQALTAQLAQSRTAAEEAMVSSQSTLQQANKAIAEQAQLARQAQASQQATLDTLQGGLNQQRRQLLELSSTDRADWSLAEAEYLLRLAYQRLLMARDLASAQALLRSADAILAELDDNRLHPVRAAIAADLAALRAVPQVDTEGTWLRIQALARQVDSLLLFQLPERSAAAPESEVEAGWQARLQHGFQAALDRFSSYLVIRRRDTAYQPLLDPQWERLVRQNLHMLLEQSQVALLSGNTELYRASLENTRRWLQEFFSFNAAGVAALDAELGSLLEINLTREYPDIGDSLVAIKDAMAARRSAAGGN